MLRSIINNLNLLRLTSKPTVTQVRLLNRPKKRYPYWFVRRERVCHDDKITKVNRDFVDQVVNDTYGQPSLIKGVQTYAQKLPEIAKPSDDIESQWTKKTRRCGVIARKIGTYPLWTKNGERLRTTLLQVVDNHVVKYTPPGEYKPMQRPKVRKLDQYGCVLVGAESADPSMLTKEYCGLFQDSCVMPKKNLTRFLVSPLAALEPGTPLNVTHFRINQRVDVRGLTKYRGFQGVMKRWGFKGMPATHGATKTHRRPGNIGGGGEKARVWPGKKMPGHMGYRWRVLKGMRILRINKRYNTMWVLGPNVAGKVGGLVYIYDTILPLRRSKTPPPFPTSYDNQLSEYEPDNIWADDMHDFKEDTITFEPEVEIVTKKRR